MSSDFELEPERFVPGTVGEPGSRVFYVQATAAGQVVSFRLEKEQVAALAEYLAGLLADLPPDADEPTDMTLVEPVVSEWVIGAMAAAYEETTDRIVIIAEEFVPEAVEAVEGSEAETPVAGAASARFMLRRGQVTAFIRRSVELVMTGRPPCPICGRPMNPDGHVCPRSNGHGRS